MTLTRHNVGANHYYTDTMPDGDEIKVPNVTGILNNGIPKSGLSWWAAGQAAEYAVEHWDELGDVGTLEKIKRIQGAARAETSKAAGKGQEIHRLAERLLHGEPVDKPEGLEGYIESCVRFLDEYEIEPVLSECAVINRAVPYAGTLDLVGDMLGQRWLLDWKTGKSVYAETALQLAAYSHAEFYLEEKREQPVAELGIERGAVVHLRADGFDVYPMDISQRTYSLFRYVAVVAAWCSWDKETGAKIDKLKGKALLPPSARRAS